MFFKNRNKHIKKPKVIQVDESIAGTPNEKEYILQIVYKAQKEMGLIGNMSYEDWKKNFGRNL